MSQKFVLTAVPGTRLTQQLQNPGTVLAIKLTNGTPFDLDISGFGAQSLLVIPAGLEYMLYASVENSGSINILPVNNNNITGTGVINMLVFFVGETLPQGNWPVTVPTQIVQAKVSTVTNLVNDGSSLGTQIIESTPAAAPGSTISILNDGTVVIKGDVGGVLTALLSLLPGAAAGASSVLLGDAARQVEVLGKLLIDGLSNFTGNILANGGINTNTIRDDTNGNTAMDMSAGDGTVAFPQIVKPNKAGTVVNGSTTGTVTFLTPIWGNSLKICLAIVSNFNSASVADFNFPSVMNQLYFGVVGNMASTTPIVALKRSGTVQNVDVLTTIASAGGTITAQTTIHQSSVFFGHGGQTYDLLEMGSDAGGAINLGIMLIGS